MHVVNHCNIPLVLIYLHGIQIWLDDAIVGIPHKTYKCHMPLTVVLTADDRPYPSALSLCLFFPNSNLRRAKATLNLTLFPSAQNMSHILSIQDQGRDLGVQRGQPGLAAGLTWDRLPCEQAQEPLGAYQQGVKVD